MSGTGGLGPLASDWDQVREALEAQTAREFEVLREIGRGGMAAVYLAREVMLDRHVAIKVLSPAMLLAEGMIERFREEAVLIARLDHPNVITIYGVREAGGLHFFVMKYVEGCSLDVVIRRAGPLPEPLVRGILAQVARGLGFAHRSGIIHRDIKPGNLLLDTSGRVIVTDFGIAKAAESSGLTKTGFVIGTAAYMSPEQCAAAPVTWASDQYSLGVVAFELLTGDRPFKGTDLQVAQAHLAEPPPDLMALRPDCTPDLAVAVRRMLAKEPTERWPSLGEALAGLGVGPEDDTQARRQQIATLAGAGQTPEQVATPSAAVEPAAEGQPPPRPESARDEGPQGLDEPRPGTVGGVVSSGSGEAGRSGTPTLTATATRWVRRHRRRVAAGIALACLVGVVTLAYTPEAGQPPTPEPSGHEEWVRPSSFEISPAQVELRVGDSVMLVGEALIQGNRIEVDPAALDWRSTGDEVASASPRGLVRGVTQGQAFIIARWANGQDSARVLVTVLEPSRVVGAIDISSPLSTLDEGEEVVIRADVLDQDGVSFPEAEIEWTSLSPQVASISPTGERTAHVRALSAGTTAIQVSAAGITSEISIRVNRPVEGPGPSVEGGEGGLPDGRGVLPDSTLDPGTLEGGGEEDPPPTAFNEFVEEVSPQLDAVSAWVGERDLSNLRNYADDEQLQRWEEILAMSDGTLEVTWEPIPGDLTEGVRTLRFRMTVTDTDLNRVLDEQMYEARFRWSGRWGLETVARVSGGLSEG